MSSAGNTQLTPDSQVDAYEDYASEIKGLAELSFFLSCHVTFFGLYESCLVAELQHSKKLGSHHRSAAQRQCGFRCAHTGR